MAKNTQSRNHAIIHLILYIWPMLDTGKTQPLAQWVLLVTSVCVCVCCLTTASNHCEQEVQRVQHWCRHLCKSQISSRCCQLLLLTCPLTSAQLMPISINATAYWCTCRSVGDGLNSLSPGSLFSRLFSWLFSLLLHSIGCSCITASVDWRTRSDTPTSCSPTNR